MIDSIVSFGRYKGRPVQEMLADASYMAWASARPHLRSRLNYLVASAGSDGRNSTPVHNALQALFLDQSFVSRFIDLLPPYVFPDNHAPGDSYKVQFEAHNNDVYFLRRYLNDGKIPWGFGVEIKPVVGDDYPEVLRQMRRQKSSVLLIETYDGAGITLSQMIQIFSSSCMAVIFRHELF